MRAVREEPSLNRRMLFGMQSDKVTIGKCQAPGPERITGGHPALTAGPCLPCDGGAGGLTDLSSQLSSGVTHVLHRYGHPYRYRYRLVAYYCTVPLPNQQLRS